MGHRGGSRNHAGFLASGEHTAGRSASSRRGESLPVRVRATQVVPNAQPRRLGGVDDLSRTTSLPGLALPQPECGGWRSVATARELAVLLVLSHTSRLRRAAALGRYADGPPHELSVPGPLCRSRSAGPGVERCDGALARCASWCRPLTQFLARGRGEWGRRRPEPRNLGARPSSAAAGVRGLALSTAAALQLALAWRAYHRCRP